VHFLHFCPKNDNFLKSWKNFLHASSHDLSFQKNPTLCVSDCAEKRYMGNPIFAIFPFLCTGSMGVANFGRSVLDHRSLLFFNFSIKMLLLTCSLRAIENRADLIFFCANYGPKSDFWPCRKSEKSTFCIKTGGARGVFGGCVGRPLVPPHTCTTMGFLAFFFFEICRKWKMCHFCNFSA